MPYLTSKLTMDEEVVYVLLALFERTTPINEGMTLVPKVINHKYFTQSYHLSEKAIRGGVFTFQMLFQEKGKTCHTVIALRNNL